MKRVPNKRWPYLLLAPAILIVCFVVFYPAIKAVLISFQSYDYHKPSQMGYIGLENYVSIMKDKLFWQSLWRTIVWDVACVGLQFVFGFALALLLNSNFKGRGIARSLSLVPWVMPGVLVGLMWRWIFDGNYGVLNDILMKLGITKSEIAFLAQPQTAFPSAILLRCGEAFRFCINDARGLAGSST